MRKLIGDAEADQIKKLEAAGMRSRARISALPCEDGSRVQAHRGVYRRRQREEISRHGRTGAQGLIETFYLSITKVRDASILIIVIPAQAGIHWFSSQTWIPAFAGMTSVWSKLSPIRQFP
jgi:hypothetical protein